VRPGRRAGHPEAEVEAIDDPLVQLLGRLRGHFEVIRAVRFAHQGRDRDGPVPGPRAPKGRVVIGE